MGLQLMGSKVDAHAGRGMPLQCVEGVGAGKSAMASAWWGLVLWFDVWRLPA